MAKFEYTLESGSDHLNCAILTRDVTNIWPSIDALRVYAAHQRDKHVQAYGRQSYMGLAFNEAQKSGRWAYGRTPADGKALYRFIGDDGLTYVVRARPMDAA